MMRFWFAVAMVLSALGMSGCQSAGAFAGAVMCQGFARPVESDSSDGWSFRGLDAGVRPRIRPGSYASATSGVHFIGPDDLGSHRYWLDGPESNGILYTCSGGHIDLAHVRKAADWTGYLAAVTLECLRRGHTTLRFRLQEPSRYFVELTYPKDWSSLPDSGKERVARDVSCQLGRYLAFTAMTWHEMLTWFGFRPKGYKSEFQSAFSWEDNYSNLLGTCVAAEALQDGEHTFSDAVTLALRRQLESLGVQPAAVARQASEAVRGDWYSKRGLFTVVRRRDFDIGLDDGCVTPCLVRSLPACKGARPHPLAAPTLDALAQYGFSAKVRIEPRVWEENKILEVLYGSCRPVKKRLDPATHFAALIDYMKQDLSNHRHLYTGNPVPCAADQAAP